MADVEYNCWCTEAIYEQMQGLTRITNVHPLLQVVD